MDSVVGDRSPDTKKKTVIKHTKEQLYSGGPLGFGDPHDTYVRRVEEYAFVGFRVRDRAHREKCAEFTEAVGKCSEQNGTESGEQERVHSQKPMIPIFRFSLFYCQPQIKQLNECLNKWYRNAEFVRECRDEYIKDRSLYRSMGIRKKLDTKPYYLSAKKKGEWDKKKKKHPI